MVEAEHIEEFENYNKNVMYIRPLKVYKKYSTPQHVDQHEKIHHL